MKQTLVIGSTVIDIIIHLKQIPKTGDDINISVPIYQLGGCAYNVFETLRYMESPAVLCSVVGSGIHGRMVKEKMLERGIEPLINLEEENGCCYCLVEQNGERTFISHQGAEFIFYKSWLRNMDFSGTDSVYICGIDIEGPTGSEIVGFLNEHPNLTIYFAPGPRIMNINPGRMKKILESRGSGGKGPILHFNQLEACSYAGSKNYKKAAEIISDLTDNTVIVTLREQGCFCYDKNDKKRGVNVPGFPAKVINTTSAGDAHFGVVISELKKGKTPTEACRTANKIAAAVTEINGVVLGKDKI